MIICLLGFGSPCFSFPIGIEQAAVHSGATFHSLHLSDGFSDDVTDATFKKTILGNIRSCKVGLTPRIYLNYFSKHDALTS